MRMSFEEYLGCFLPDSEYREVMLQLLTIHPDATWRYTKFPDSNGNVCLPYLKTEAGYFVECVVTAGNVTRSYLLPILDEEGEVLLQGVNVNDVQCAHETCFVICAALFGIAAQPHAHVAQHPPVEKPTPAEMKTASSNVTDFQDAILKKHQSRNHYEIVSVAVSEKHNPHYVIRLRNADEDIEVHAALEEVERFESQYGNFSGFVKLDKEYVRLNNDEEFWVAKNFNQVS